MMRNDKHTVTGLPSLSLSGKVALITGASRGLGFEMAKGMALAGAQVWINGRNPSALEIAKQQLADCGLHVSLIAFDVEDERAVTNAIASLITLHGRIDILVNNVGMRDRRGLFELDRQAMRGMLDNHLIAAFDLARTASRFMIEQGEGRIINMVSVSAFLASPGDAAYITAKGALVALTRALAAELGHHGITVNAIAPGPFATETNQAIAASEKSQAWLAARSSLGRWGRPEEIAGAAVFLASASASFVTGHVLAVDGGLLGHY